MEFLGRHPLDSIIHILSTPEVSDPPIVAMARGPPKRKWMVRCKLGKVSIRLLQSWLTFGCISANVSTSTSSQHGNLTIYIVLHTIKGQALDHLKVCDEIQVNADHCMSSNLACRPSGVLERRYVPLLYGFCCTLSECILMVTAKLTTPGKWASHGLISSPYYFCIKWDMKNEGNY